MPSTAKESIPETVATSTVEKSDAQPSQPNGALGAEIPVTVHASRYSGASKSAGKLPPIHEETRTVIIFPQGAVVRLSATVTPGELVVLTNKRSGADVVCRVTSIKTQPGIQNYVNLEFAQRAVGFWEESRQVEPASPAEQSPAASTAPTVVPPAPTPISAAFKTPAPVMAEAQPVVKSPMPVAEVKSVSAQSLKVTSLADVPTVNVAGAEEDEDPAPVRVSEITPAPVATLKQPRILPSRTPRLQSFEVTRPAGGKSTKKIALMATAAVALLALGAAGGAFLLQRDRSTTVAQQIPASSLTSPVSTAAAPPPTASAPAPPMTNASSRAGTLEPVASSSARNSSLEVPAPAPVRMTVETPRAEVQTQPAPAVRPTIKLGKIVAPKMKSTQLNSSEPPPVLADANGLPRALSDSAFNTVARSGPIAPEPAPVAPTKGGQLQQPKLVSSVTAVYPANARTQRIQGDVLIDALVDASGKVTEVKLISGHPLLQQAAMDSLRLWRYAPARLNGDPIPVHIKVSVAFRLQ
jgi:periplasmic protein TonB